MIDRRKFFKQGSFLAAGVMATPLMGWKGGELPDEVELEKLSDDELWAFVRSQYNVDRSQNNFNNGAIGVMPNPVLKKFELAQKANNYSPSDESNKVRIRREKVMRPHFSMYLEVEKQELAFVRNATEALNNIIFGFPFEKGDEVIVGEFEYPHVWAAWRQCAKFKGVRLKKVAFHPASTSDEELVNLYKAQMTKKTRMVCVSHIVSFNGRVMPIKEIIQEAHQRGIEVLVDAAHSLGQIPFTMTEYPADYIAFSLHKWMGAPHGTGLLYTQKDKISKIIPLCSCEDLESNNSTKFEQLGSRNFSAMMGMEAALDFQKKVGVARINSWLVRLNSHFMEQVSKIDGISLLTPTKKGSYGAMATLHFEGVTNKEMFRIVHTIINYTASPVRVGDYEGIRFSPHVYHSLEEIEFLVENLKKAYEEVRGKSSK